MTKREFLETIQNEVKNEEARAIIKEELEKLNEKARIAKIEEKEALEAMKIFYADILTETPKSAREMAENLQISVQKVAADMRKLRKNNFAEMVEVKPEVGAKFNGYKIKEESF